MNVAIGIFLGIAMLISLAATVLTDIELWTLIGESRKSFRKLSPERRRGVVLRLVAVYIVAFGYTAVVLIAPFGVRKTLTYFVILPFVMIVPVAVIAIGIRGFRGQRRGASPNRYTRVRRRS